MAVYRLKEMKDGTYRVWARYQPFKGAATKSRVSMVRPEALAEEVMQAAEWVKEQRKGKKT